MGEASTSIRRLTADDDDDNVYILVIIFSETELRGRAQSPQHDAERQPVTEV